MAIPPRRRLSSPLSATSRPASSDLARSVDGVITGAAFATRQVAVSAPLASILPAGGLQPGTIVGVTGDAAVSLAFALMAHAVDDGKWLGIIGARRLGLAAMMSSGVPLERTVVFEPEPSDYRVTLSIVIDGFDLVIVTDDHADTLADHRLVARIKERNAVVVAVEGGIDASWGRRRWVTRPDVMIDAAAIKWEGLGRGHGSLSARLVEVAITSRRQGRPTVGRLWLPGRQQPIEAATDGASDANLTTAPSVTELAG